MIISVIVIIVSVIRRTAKRRRWAHKGDYALVEVMSVRPRRVRDPDPDPDPGRDPDPDPETQTQTQGHGRDPDPETSFFFRRCATYVRGSHLSNTTCIHVLSSEVADNVASYGDP